MVYAKFGGQTECIMGNWKIENSARPSARSERANERRGQRRVSRCFRSILLAAFPPSYAGLCQRLTLKTLDI